MLKRKLKLKYLIYILFIVISVSYCEKLILAQDSHELNGVWLSPKWSPDGKKISCIYKYSQGDEFVLKMRLYIFNSDGTNKTLIADDIGDESEWSPDGKMLLYGQIPEEKDESINLDLEEIYPIQQLINYNLDNKTKTNIDTISVGGYFRTFFWILNGKKIVYDNGDLYTANADASNIKRIADEDVISSFQGNYNTGIIAYAVYGGKVQREIYLLNIENGTKKKISDSCIGGLQWNIQGDRIIFEEFDDIQGSDFLCVIDNTGSNKKRFFDTSHIETWSCSPDGRKILYCTGFKLPMNKNPSLNIINIDTGISEKIYEFNNRYYRSIGWTPDGQKIFFEDNEKIEGEGLLKTFLYIVDLKTKTIKEKITPSPGNAFSPDGNKIYRSHRRCQSDKIVVYDLETKKYIDLNTRKVLRYDLLKRMLVFDN